MEGITRRRALVRAASTGVTVGTYALLRPAAAAADPRPSRGFPVDVYCGSVLGPSGIADFLGSGDGIAYRRTAADPAVHAWRRLGFRWMQTGNVEWDTFTPWIKTSRDAGGGLLLDFTRWDRRLTDIRDLFHATPVVHIHGVPKVMSSKPDDRYSAAYMPRDMAEWEDFNYRIAAHTARELGMTGLVWHTHQEPDYPDQWHGTGSGDTLQTLREHIELHASAYRGIKRADPTALVGGPGTMSWSPDAKYIQGGARFGLEDWLRELARRHNEHNASGPVPLDFVSWQDYGWMGGVLSNGADAASDYLAQAGLDPALPKILTSGDGAWGSDYGDESLTPSMRASHIAWNVIREFRDPGQRRFALALYYTFYWTDRWASFDPATWRVALVSARRFYKPVRLTPMYAIFQMLRPMARGEMLHSSAELPLVAMSSRSRRGDKVIVLINNHTRRRRAAIVTLHDLPFRSSRSWLSTQHVNAVASVAGTGLEVGTWRTLPVKDGRVTVPVLLRAHGTTRLRAWPA
jgi:hypothetical protein